MTTTTKRIQFKHSANSSSRKSSLLSRRVLAFTIDILILQFTIKLLTLISSSSNIFGENQIWKPVFLVICYLIYYTWLEASSLKGTLAKRFFRLTVTSESGNKLSLWQSIARTLIRPLSLFSVIGILMINFNEKQQTLHDKLSQSLVQGR